ncbi:hypothetical protein LIER_05611 [Lithospermum erythrorhizon]|uniref:Uncharacterized protein n=1 Tax=Lithospermum erythrorhizon TaxID=34254 RepID=A0AAV3P5Y1_LITER
MDLDTENRIASILMKEAAELRRQAQQEGALAYIRRPNVRGRPNSRFLTATVLGVQQANRNVDENEMWRSRKKEKELDSRLKGRFREESSSGKHHKDFRDCGRGRSKRVVDSGLVDPSSASPSMKTVSEDIYSRDDDGLKDDEIEEFLHSRSKRGRGAIGSRMDETGPFLTSCSDSTNNRFLISDNELDEQPKRVVRGPKRPASLMSDETSSDESPVKRKSKKRKLHSEKHKSKEKSKHKSREKLKDRKKKRKREEKRSKSH